MNENLLRKYQNGELSDAEILAADVAVKRAAIEAEAERRERIRIEQETGAAAREHRLQKMVFLDREAEAATRDLENLLQEFDEFCLNFGRRFLATRYRIVRSQMAFGREVNKAVENVNKINSSYAPEIENQLSELLETIEKRGASLSSICSEIWQPHLHYAPVFCRSNAYDFPATHFGALLTNIEKIISHLPEPPTPEDETTAQTEETGNLKLWAFARAEAERADVGEPPQEKAA